MVMCIPGTRKAHKVRGLGCWPDGACRNAKPYSKNTKRKNGWEVVKMVEHLRGKHGHKKEL
jgi:hypothetical protein